MKVNVAQYCPYPIGCIFESAKALFEVIVPMADHKDAIDEGLEQGIGLHVDWEPIREVADIDGNNKISLHANFCQFLWMLNYCMLVVYDCGQIAEGKASDPDISPEQAQIMFSEASDMMKVALTMFLGRKDNPKEMLTQRGELFAFPNPVNKQNKYTEIASALTISGIAYLLQHEYAHFVKQHDESTPALEAEADQHGFEKLLQWGKNQPYENVSITGPMMALAATAFLNPAIVGNTHPDIDTRIENLFQTYRKICGKEVPESATKLLITTLITWSYARQLPLSPIEENESDLAYLLRLQETLILPLKRQSKII